jgi:hypothetical protein
MTEETGGEKPKEQAPNWQPLIDAIAPKAAEILERLLAGARESAEHALRVERWVVLLAGGVVLTVAVSATIAALEGSFDTVERLLIPLISFAGGFGIGARISRQTSRAS